MAKDDYGEMLKQYLEDIQQDEALSKEMKRQQAIERTFNYSYFDFAFPWHMKLGKYERNTKAFDDEDEDS